ncbi:MAG: hypothetical protein HDT14_00860 [Oscillibacter sp.]|nr:hypothetical protein [Oscillibacter sp.]
MGCSKTEDAGGLTPVKDDNEAAPHFSRRTLLFFSCFDYKLIVQEAAGEYSGTDFIRVSFFCGAPFLNRVGYMVNALEKAQSAAIKTGDSGCPRGGLPESPVAAARRICRAVIFSLSS